MEDLPLHPDRSARTLAVRATPGPGPFAAPGPGSADARVDLKLLLHEARVALAERGTEAARRRFADIDAPHLLAGTIQDGTARGVMAALEEVLSLCSGTPGLRPEDRVADEEAQVFEGRELRRKKDILVASAGSRIRWSRKGGVLLVDREHGIHAEDCIRFEDRRDLGDLDGFVPDTAERPRLFSPAFLGAARLTQGPTFDRLELVGRLGRRADGFPCRVDFIGDKQESQVRMVVRIVNRHDDHRLRVRFLGCRNPAAVPSAGTPGYSEVLAHSRWFLAATLVRACGRLQTGDGGTVATPAAQVHGELRHEFRLGGAPWVATPS
ncbi:MAG: hypothetical protein RL562_70 [Planctomycetota bacterium]